MAHGTIIVATDRNWLIGDRPDPTLSGTTPWQGQLPVDMRYFKAQTKNRPVIFARPTYESISEKHRPLIGRTNVIWTRQETYDVEGTTTVHSLDEAFDLFPNQELMICGGGHLYRVALEDPRVDIVLRTRVDGEFNGNVYFPALDEDEWRLIHSDFRQADGENLQNCAFETYVRKSAMLVDPRNARTPEYVAELLKIQRSRKCPFCPDGKTLTAGEDEIIAQNNFWYAIRTHTPVKGAEHHWVIISKTHLTSLQEVAGAYWSEMERLLRGLQRMHEVTGGALFVREGDTEVSGATVRHIHFNYVVPDSKANQAACAWFGQYREPNQSP